MTITITFGEYGGNDGNATTNYITQRRVRALAIATGSGAVITRHARVLSATGTAKSTASVTTYRPTHVVQVLPAQNYVITNYNSQHTVQASALTALPSYGTVTTYYLQNHAVSATGDMINNGWVRRNRHGKARVHAVRATQVSDIVITNNRHTVGASYTPPITNFGIMLAPSPLMYSELGAPTNFLVDSFQMLDVNEEQMVMALMDAFTMSDSMSAVFQALQQLFDKLSMRDIALLLYRANLIDSFLMTATPVNQAKVLALLADAFVLDDTLDPLAQVLAVLNSSMRMYVTLNTGFDTYSAWVMTPESKAVRSYSNYPFNSFIMLGTQYLAAGDAGVFIMGADDDALPAANTPIKARVRSGLKDFGTSKMKRIDRAYIGYKSSGTLCLRVCATLHSGEKVVYTYQMVPTTADAPVESRVAVGRGVRSVYWSFELCNDTDSSTFEMYDMRVLPMILSQRIP